MKRSREAIIAHILEICTDGASKTKIVYQANLNFRTVLPYIDLLIKNDLLICCCDSSIIYKTTSKGLNILKELKNIYYAIPEIY